MDNFICNINKIWNIMWGFWHDGGWISVGFTWRGQRGSLIGCQPSRFLGIGGSKAGKPRQPEAPCQPTEVLQKSFAHYASIYRAFLRFSPTIMPEEPIMFKIINSIIFRIKFFFWLPKEMSFISHKKLFVSEQNAIIHVGYFVLNGSFTSFISPHFLFL